MKVCSKCHIEKDESEFGVDKNTKDGHKYACKICRNKQEVGYSRQNPERKRGRSLKWFRKNKDRYIGRSSTQQRISYMNGYYKINKQDIIKQHKGTKKRHIKQLADCYLRDQLRVVYGFTNESLDRAPVLIELLRNIIKIKRNIYGKTKRQKDNSNHRERINQSPV